MQLLRRRLAERYRGSLLGVGWALLLPVAMLAVYTLFFRHLLGLRWPVEPAAGDLLVAANIFVGLAVVNFAGEVLSAAPRLVLEHPAFVRKMRFPLSVLAYVLVGAAAVQMLIALGVVTVVGAAWDRISPGGMAAAVLHLVPVMVWALAGAWLLGALGVFIRDLQHLVPPLVTALLFLSPVFYPAAALPAPWRSLVMMNPLTLPIEGVRAALLGGVAPGWGGWALQLLVAVVAAVLARGVFVRVQPGFADVI